MHALVKNAHTKERRVVSNTHMNYRRKFKKVIILSKVPDHPVHRMEVGRQIIVFLMQAYEWIFIFCAHQKGTTRTHKANAQHGKETTEYCQSLSEQLNHRELI